MKWVNRLKFRRRSDRGDALLVMSIIFVPFMFICVGFAMDLTKAVYVKQQYQIMGQEATTAAARNLNSNGSITNSAAAQVVQVYADRFKGKDSSTVNSGNSNNFSTNEATYGVRDSACQTVTLEDGSTKPAPYMVITLNGGRNDVDNLNGTTNEVVYVSEGGAAPTIRSGTYNDFARYYTISARIYDTAPNLLLGMFGKNCQQVVSEVSSVTFGSRNDVDSFSNSPGPTPPPGCPPGVAFTDGTSATLSWSSVAGATSYKVTNEQGWSQATSSGTTMNVSSATAPYDRTWTVTATNSAGTSSNCATYKYVAPAPTATCPTGIGYTRTAWSPSSTTYQVNWSAVSPNDTLTITGRNNTTGTTQTVTAAESGLNTSITIPLSSTQANSLAFTISVPGNANCDTRTISSQTPAPAPTCPTGIYYNKSSNDASTMTYQLYWTQSGAAETLRWRIFNNSTGVETIHTASESGSGTFKSFAASSGQTVTFSVTAVNADGVQSAVCAGSQTTVTAPTTAAPTCPANFNVSVSRTTSTEVSLNITWTPQGATDDIPYTILRNGSTWSSGTRGENAVPFAASLYSVPGDQITVTIRAQQPGGGTSVACTSKTVSAP